MELLWAVSFILTCFCYFHYRFHLALSTGGNICLHWVSGYEVLIFLRANEGYRVPHYVIVIQHRITGENEGDSHREAQSTDTSMDINNRKGYKDKRYIE